jgi:hypothetical protein
MICDVHGVEDCNADCCRIWKAINRNPPILTPPPPRPFSGGYGAVNRKEAERK